MSYYECYRCSHRTKQKIEILRHLNRKIKCERSIDSYKYTDDEIKTLSLEKKNTNNEDNIVNSKNLQNIYICEKCNKSYSRKFNLDRHKDKCCSKTNVETNIVNINNTCNTSNTINNNILINLKIEPFDNEWDVSKINKFTRHSLLFSKIMYTNLLKTILDNENNLNVIIEKDKNEGVVYKNNMEKFIKMNLKDIVDDSMFKLNKHLKDFYNESINDEEFILMDTLFEEQKNMIETKYKDYKTNKETQKIVEEFITEIYDKKKETTLKLYKQVLLENNETDLLDGF